MCLPRLMQKVRGRMRPFLSCFMAVIVLCCTVSGMMLSGSALSRNLAGSDFFYLEDCYCGVMTYSGPDYRLHLLVTEDADIPRNARLKVKELKTSSPDYEALASKASEKGGEEMYELSSMRLFEIDIMSGLEKIEPAVPVEVVLELADGSGLRDGEEKLAFGLAGDEAEILSVQEHPETGPARLVRQGYGIATPSAAGRANENIGGIPAGLAGLWQDRKATPSDMPALSSAAAVPNISANDNMTAVFAATPSDAGAELRAELFEGGSNYYCFVPESLSVVGTAVGTFGGTRTLTAETNGCRISLSYGPEAKIPAGTKLKAEEIPAGTPEYEEYAGQAADRISEEQEIGEGAKARVNYARFFDIQLIYKGKEIEPAAAVDVKIEIPDPVEEDLQAVHFAEEQVEVLEAEVNTSPEGMTPAEDSIGLQTEADDTKNSAADEDITDGKQVSFTAESFSVFGLVSIVIEKYVLASDGRTYKITVTFGPEAEIPADAELQVSEIEEDSEEYTNQMDLTMRALSNGEDGPAAISQARFFDIAIVSGGEIVEPKAPVQVAVEYTEPVPAEEDADFKVVHFHGEEPEIIDTELEDGTSFEFETESFSTFAFAQANYVGPMGGMAFAIVGNDTSALLSLAHATAGRLQGVYVNELETGKLTSVTTKGGSVESSTAITVWTFEHVRDNFYYICADDGTYLNMARQSGTGLTTSSEPCLIEIVPYTGETVTIDGKKYLNLRKVGFRVYDGDYYFINLKGGNRVNGYQTTTANDANSRFSLYSSADIAVPEAEMARKISVQDIQAAQDVVIYQRVWNTAAEKYEFYVLDGSGNLVYAFDEGDYIAYRSGTATTWYVIEHIDENTGLPSGYYDFVNTETHKYLAPQHNQILSDGLKGVLLSGKSAGQSNTTIEAWDADNWAYYGYDTDLTNRILVPGTGSDSQEFSFALPDVHPAGEFHEVETVSSKDSGIRIRMYDFPTRAKMNIIGDDTWYKDGTFKQGLVKRRLGADGLPVGASTNKSFGDLYNDTYYKGEGDHLFLKGIYDSTGYYEYNSFTNFAHYDEATGDFTVYDEQGVPNQGIGGSTGSFYRGNFMPYDMMDITRPSLNTRLFDGRDNMTFLDDPGFNGTLYLMEEESPDYFFGTVVEGNFLQTEDGLDENGNPIIYDFYGDDDLWLFVDGVLVLDIGGIHSAIPGTVNFATGEVVAGDLDTTRVTTTIKECYKEAGCFPDGEPWDDSKADDYFKGDTFADFSGHKMTMVFQERGAGASTLRLRFNLPVVDEGIFSVTKKLDGTEQAGYANVQFAYQAFVDLEGEDDIPIRPGIILDDTGHIVEESAATPEQLEHKIKVTYESNGHLVDFYDGLDIGGTLYDHVFYLKPDETAVFANFPENVKYYVQEVDVSGAYYKTVMINSADMGGEGGIPEDSAITAKSSSRTIQQRQKVLFKNKCSDKNLRDLRITKHVDNPTDDGSTFEFRIRLEDLEGNLSYYGQGDYYVVKPITEGGEDHYYQYEGGVLTDRGTTPVVCSISGPAGTIAGIPDGYTVVIRGILAGTDFLVEEIRNPNDYVQISKTVQEGSCDPAEVEGADGSIALGKNAQVTITNRRLSKITAKKAWEGADDVKTHGDINLTVCKITEDGEVPMTKGDILMSDELQTITAPALDGAQWYLDLPAGGTLEDYAVREVLVEVKDGVTVLTPISEGRSLTVPGEVLLSDETVNNVYAASYRKGAEVINHEAANIREREDTVTNTRARQVSFHKVDTADTDKSLGGAEFDLFRAEKNADDEYEAVEPAIYKGLVSSAEDGLLRDGGTAVFGFAPGVYHLVETKPPLGYKLKESPTVITVTASEVTYDDHSSISEDGSGRSVKDGVTTLKIVNSIGYVLPSAGGKGTKAFRILGLLMLLAGILSLVSAFRPSRRGKAFLLTAVIFLGGAGVLFYPEIANFCSVLQQGRAIVSYEDSLAGMNRSEYEGWLERAREYNRRLEKDSSRWTESPERTAAYEEELSYAPDGNMGYVTIEKLGVKMPIYHGAAETSLRKGAGHLQGSSLPAGSASWDKGAECLRDPEEGTHVVLAGHRGLASARFFTDLDKLEEGDIFTLHILDTELAYQVDNVWVTEPEDLSGLGIRGGYDYCTLMTCTPYGINTHRLLVRGRRVSADRASEIKAAYKAPAAEAVPAAEKTPETEIEPAAELTEQPAPAAAEIRTR